MENLMVWYILTENLTWRRFVWKLFQKCWLTVKNEGGRKCADTVQNGQNLIQMCLSDGTCV